MTVAPNSKALSKMCLLAAGIRSQPISSHTPTANAVIETVHKTVGQIVRTLNDILKPKSVEEAENLADPRNCYRNACLSMCLQ